jgi:predicted transglutaminase-like cysteine proteinase
MFLSGWAAQPATAIVSSAKTRPYLLGTIEFHGVPLGGWYQFSDKVGESLELLSRCARSLARCPNRNVVAILAETAKLRKSAPYHMLAAVNRLANRHPYRADLANFHKREHWASPLEFLASSGDCEDYAIFKYALLRHLGMPADSLRIVLLRRKADGLGHAVLAAYLDDKIYILDNVDGFIRTQNEFRSYTAVFSFNENLRWAHIESSPGANTQANAQAIARAKAWAPVRGSPGSIPDLHDREWSRPDPAGSDLFSQLYAAVFSSSKPNPNEYRVQIGAFRSLEDANHLWQRVWRDQWDLLGSSEPRIYSQTRSGGGQLHLLQIGATTSARRAAALCEGLSGRGVDCFVVRPAAQGAVNRRTRGS